MTSTNTKTNNTTRSRQPTRCPSEPPFDCVALLLQGGGALGAYQRGVYDALADVELHPHWVAGVSLGAIFIALIGAADSVTVAVRMTTVQLTTPDNMRGRAYAFLVLVAQTANNIGTLWVGLWSEVIGAQRTMLMGSFLAMGATLLIWRLWRPIREYRS